ncbi:discoidin domain-containing protein [Crossiella sp. SN42]|uniref:discoidin domain-containing protein n=1 Tax=Crossiella sp. SN42 TaxID=2944808 RepID=UPI00207C4D89|nr:discoidin domain-containing protein [Crossiella sp. SN42]MCO1578550.1 discoidin domain-containing protein [Crossiella sp. SN42]
MSTPVRRRSAIVVLFSVLALLGLGVTPAAAEVVHPRQDWLRAATAGLFLHWGMRTSPGYTSCSAWENAITAGGWSPDYWITEARKLHAQYLVLASFHSRLGYGKAWPSKVPGSCATKRDFVRELLDAADKRDMKVIMYMTDDPQWHQEGRPSGSWLDSAAYSRYKGRNVDITTRDGFGEYSYDSIVEVAQRYPELAGFWIDNDNAFWERNGLYERVRKERPHFLLSNNNEDTPIMDTISNEQKTGMSPDYDYPQAVYTAAPRLIEACFKLPSTGPWWHNGSDSAVDYQLTIGRYVTNLGSDVKALMAETAMVNGKFPAKQAAFNNFLKGYFDQIRESIHGMHGGGYGHGGLKPGFWNDGAHGVTTVAKDNPDRHYIHTLTRPSGSTLRLRDNGYRVLKVTNLRTGAPVKFSQANGSLTLTGVTDWDQYDTVFRVDTGGRTGVYPANAVTVTASASAAGHGPALLNDGDHATYWDSDKTTPVSLRFDLGARKPVRYLALNQREDSVSYARSATEQSARIKDYRVHVSEDGANWGSPVASGQLPSHRGVSFVDIPQTTARHVRLEVVSTWAAASDGKRHKQLRVDEAWLGSAHVS